MNGIFSDTITAVPETPSAPGLCRKVRFTDDYRETRRNILENYSDPNLYTIASTQSGNVYVFRKYYCLYMAGALNSNLMSKLETEIKNGTPVRVPLARLGDLPQPDYNIASDCESVKDEGRGFPEIEVETPVRAPFARLGDLPQPGNTIASDDASLNDGGL